MYTHVVLNFVAVVEQKCLEFIHIYHTVNGECFTVVAYQDYSQQNLHARTYHL